MAVEEDGCMVEDALKVNVCEKAVALPRARQDKVLAGTTTRCEADILA